MKKVAITGGLSSGKSSVCEILQKKGAYVVSADEIVHNLLSPESPTASAIVELLGVEIIENGKLNRAKIAQIVFEKPKTLKALEKILHPAVLEEIEKEYNQVKNQNKFRLFVAEIPLLYEIESQHLFDTVITVTSDPEIAKKRFQEKTHHSAQEFENRMMNQLPVEQKIAKADYVVLNNGTFAELEAKTNTLYQNLTQE